MKIGILGAGVMGETFIESLCKRRIVAPGDILVSDLGRGRLRELERKFGVRTTLDNETIVQQTDVVMICVKPQAAAQTLKPLHGLFHEPQVLLSIMAGVSLDTIRRFTGHQALVRAMPNTPARLGLGMTVWMATEEIPDTYRMIVKMIFQACGEDLEVHEEKMIDAATAVSGSGPAYIFYMAENLIRAAESLGFSTEQADRLAQQTFVGAMQLWQETGEDPESLRHNVTSKGGTTAAAIHHFEEGNTPSIFTGAIHAAFVRAEELRNLADADPES